MSNSGYEVNPLYGLAEIDPGDWVRGKEPATGAYIENTKTGFRVYYLQPHPRYSSLWRFVVCKDGFWIGFSFEPILYMAIHQPRAVSLYWPERHILNLKPNSKNLLVH